jgi:two-component system sensor histidine kinase KdpD
VAVGSALFNVGLAMSLERSASYPENANDRSLREEGLGARSQKARDSSGAIEIIKAIALVVATNGFYLGTVYIDARPPLALTFLLPILLAAIRWRAPSAIVTAIGCAASLAYFYFDPFYTYNVEGLSRSLGVFVFLGVSVFVGAIASRARSDAARAHQKENEIGDLYSFSRQLSLANSPASIFEATRQHLEGLVGRRVLLFDSVGASAGQPERLGDVETPIVVSLGLKKIQTAGADGAKSVVVHDERGNAWLVRPISVDTADFGVIAVDLGQGSALSQDLHSQVVALIGDAASSLERLGLARTIAEARTRAETEQFRETLIGSVSYELSNPLTAILNASGTLVTSPDVANNIHLKKLVLLIIQESERLDKEVHKFLDASRISSQGLPRNLEWVEPADIVNGALRRCRNRLKDRAVEITLPEELVLVRVDAELMEKAVEQILDNAAKYSLPETSIMISGELEAEHFAISIRDKGAGLDADDRAMLGQRFFRSKRLSSMTSGVGLGFWIARAFVAANGGTIEVTSEGPDKGLVVTLRLPLSLKPAS